jgi:flavodoxin
MKVMVLYYSKTGHTLEAVNALAEGVRQAGSDVDLVTVKKFDSATLASYDGFIVGSPCWAGSITSGGVAKAVLRVLNALPDDCLKGKRCAGISVHSQMGGKTTIRTLGKLLAKKGCEDSRPGPAAKAGTPFSLWKGPSVGALDEEVFKAFGVEFVTQDGADTATQ